VIRILAPSKETIMTAAPSTTVTTIRDLARALSRAVQDTPGQLYSTSMSDLSTIRHQAGSIYAGLDTAHALCCTLMFDPDRVGLLTQALELSLSSMLPAGPAPTTQIRAQYLPTLRILTVLLGEPR
jgi:hypothetical protein